MKSIRKDKDKNLTFPRLMRYKTADIDFIVLFTSKEVGIVIQKNSSDYDIGYHRNDWYMPDFEDYDGEVVLSNS